LLFSTPGFLFVFLPLALLGFIAARRSAGVNAALTFLAVASVVFYGMWRVEYVPLFLGSVLFNAILARLLVPGAPRTRGLLVLGVAANLGLLFWFKYSTFVSVQLAAAGVVPGPLPPQALPLAISFYTFQQIAYLVDVSRADAPRVPFLKHLLFVAFFPHLIAGPITHPRTILPQLDDPRPTLNSAALGLFILAIGLGKKVLLADPLGRFVDPAFANPGALSQGYAAAAVACYTLQLYFDFSGYSDMAIGLGLLFGVRLPWNFLSPYKSRNISEFWRRWHVTLSDFLKNYLYIPLGGSRRGRWRTAVNLLIVMLLGGIWHGAGWTYALWGAVHGSALAAYHLSRPYLPRIPAPVGWVMTMALVTAGWVLFRSPNLAVAGQMFRALAGNAPGPLSAAVQRDLPRVLPYLALAAGIALLGPSSASLAGRFTRRGAMSPWGWWGALLMGLSVLFMLGQITPPEFLYFDF
jgi:D-alanyl-lipoteichoic acid acyltransferase DltB (MBOAT superfamily)